MPITQLKKVARLAATKTPTVKPLAKTIESTLNELARVREPVIDESVPRIEVHDTVSNVAWAYEKLRQAIDYQDEHLLRKNAIERILKRRLISGVAAKQVAEPLILELIRGRYLPNKTLPATLIGQAADILNAYIHLWTQVPWPADSAQSRRLLDFWYGLISVQLNELLSPIEQDKIMAELMYNVVHRDFIFAAGELEGGEEEKNTQLFISIQRTLLKADTNIIRYHLFLRLFPDWPHADTRLVQTIAKQFPAIRDHIESQILHPVGDLLQRVMKKYAIIFWTFEDLVQQYGPAAKDKFMDADTVAQDVAAVYGQRRKFAQMKIARSVIRSIIYVFITKMILALLLELPADRIFARGAKINYMPLFVNIGFHPFLLLLIGITNQVPGKKNLDALVEKVQALLYRGDERNSLVKPRRPIRRNAWFTALYRTMYALTFLIVFGLIIMGLFRIDFTIFSVAIFLLFLTIVSFFGIRVRLIAKELLVVDQRESFFSVLFDFFTVPILQVGRWISMRVPKINVLIFFMDVIIEAPFKAFLEATEGFFGFLKEKREEIY